MEAEGMSCGRMSRCSCGSGFPAAVSWRSAAVQGFYHDSVEYRCAGSDGSCIHGAVGSVDNYQYSQCGNVGCLRGPWRGTCGGNGNNVDILPPQLGKRYAGLAEIE